MLKKHFLYAVVCMLLVQFSCSDDSKSDPEPEPAGTTVTKDGGSLESSDKNISVEIPAGAVGESVNIEVKESVSDLTNGVGKIYSLTSQEFLKPVTLELKYTDADVAAKKSHPELLRLMTRPSSADAWQVVDGFTIDKEDKTLSAQVDHFSDWTIIAVDGTLNFSVDGVDHENLTLAVLRSTKNPNPASFRAQNNEFYFRAGIDSTVMGSAYETHSSYLGRITTSNGTASDTVNTVFVEPAINNCYYRKDGSSRWRFTRFSTTPGELVTGHFLITATTPNNTNACDGKKTVTGTFAYVVR
ncbi:hypothetical protein [Pseudochryseolinea flava]|uniref:ZU5 domain-containing protein n=1 Tax=Pseudochryseolinea flava TaxID=2059302 RepID=A0A364Y6X0_9BACT|nr:hypothetical protein [Pseudochryseolinea flava]RAW02854.1 hypothetical protein DQQ10_01730 [Pseudochryseolinea flava]